MSDLVTWLRTQLDRDEYLADTAGVMPWTVELYPLEVERFHDAFDAARVVHEVEAKRQILDEHETLEDTPGVRYCRCCEGDRGYPASGPPPCRTVRLLALPYANRPGYLEEWAP